MPSRLQQKLGGRICPSEQQLAYQWAPLSAFAAWCSSVMSTFTCFIFDTFAQFTHVCTNQSFYWFIVEGKRFKPDLRVVHVRDLNFVLRSEIVVHTDRQHWASHLIHSCDPVYSTWQSFIQALLWIAYFYHTSTFDTPIFFRPHWLLVKLGTSAPDILQQRILHRWEMNRLNICLKAVKSTYLLKRPKLRPEQPS